MRPGVTPSQAFPANVADKTGLPPVECEVLFYSAFSDFDVILSGFSREGSRANRQFLSGHRSANCAQDPAGLEVLQDDVG